MCVLVMLHQGRLAKWQLPLQMGDYHNLKMQVCRKQAASFAQHVYPSGLKPGPELLGSAPFTA